MDFLRTSMLMTFKSMAHVRLLQSTRSQRRFPTAPVTLRPTRGRTGWCWTRTNPTSGVQVSVINYQPLRYRSLASPLPITPTRSVHDLGIYTDADLSMRANVKRTVSRCHVPDAGSGSGTLTTRLRQYSTGRHSGLPAYIPAPKLHYLKLLTVSLAIKYKDSLWPTRLP